MAKPKKPVTRWSDGTTAIEDLGACERLAHEIVSEFADLSPSVERIMNAEELDDSQRERALVAFQISLGVTGDPNRDPRVAITNASK
jgi:hypothetical protein